MSRLRKNTGSVQPQPVSQKPKVLEWYRPLIYGDQWDRMDDDERRKMFRSDLILGVGGAALVYWCVKLVGDFLS